MTKNFLFSLLLATVLSTLSCAAQTNSSGAYEGLMLATDAQGHITGYYQQSQGEGVTKTCAFFLGGRKSNQDHDDVITWADQSYPGTLQFKNGSVNLKVEQARDYPGCSLVLLPQIANKGLTLEATVSANWTSLRTIQVDRAYFYSAPADDKKRRAFVVRGDVVGVLGATGQWLEAEYYDADKAKIVTRGWIKKTDTSVIEPPSS